MGSIKEAKKVKLFVGMISQNVSLFDGLKAKLVAEYGDVDWESQVIDFDFTKYYAKEMGTGLKRKFISFKSLKSYDDMPAIKHFTNDLEEEYALHGKREINLDPGYLDLSKVVLLTTKDFSHRLYLANNIYGEVTFNFEHGTAKFHPWTYPDYQSEAYLDYFYELRNIYSQQIKGLR